MKRLLAFVLMIVLAGAVYAGDTGNRAVPAFKGDLHVGQNPGTPDGREGGETIGTAFVIPGLPFSDSGNTCDNVNDYDEVCPYSGSTSPDVVYAYAAGADVVVDIDLCYSSYDTKVYVYQDSYTPGSPYACNDDAHFAAPCYVYSSMIEQLTLSAGHTYYIVVDGYGGDCGDYVMDITTWEPCILECPDYGLPEGEPPLVDGYVDMYNGGCNSTPPVFQPIYWIDDETGCGWLCGVSGWYIGPGGGSYRDTDWFEVIAAETMMSFTVDAEQPVNMFVLNTDCNNITILYSATAGPCFPSTITWPTTPGEVFWLWVGPTTFSGPVNEFDYLMEVCGHYYDTVPTEQATWGNLKDQYR